MKKVLHITNWYPNKWNDVEALFVKEQFNLFSEVTAAKLLHVEVRHSRGWFRYRRVKYSDDETGYYILTKITTFRIIEVLSTLLLFWALFQNKANRYDKLHFHIAYPLLTYYHIWKKFLRVPVIISEHWSAYHYNFYMPKETKKLNRIKNIFHQGLPLITVSKALLEDIETFAGTDKFPSYVIPNVIDLETYQYKAIDERTEKLVFFSVNLWRSIKNPFPMLDAFSKLVESHIDFELRIGGYGPILEEMQAYVTKKGLDAQVVFLGKLYKDEIALEMNQADAYLFSSKYETFSAVCAQALCCGCPLIGPKIPAILEYAGSKEMITLDKNSERAWIEAINSFKERYKYFDRQQISNDARMFLSYKKIRALYKEVIL